MNDCLDLDDFESRCCGADVDAFESSGGTTWYFCAKCLNNCERVLKAVARPKRHKMVMAAPNKAMKEN
jgi:hypothetical protein